MFGGSLSPSSNPMFQERHGVCHIEDALNMKEQNKREGFQSKEAIFFMF